MNRELGERSMVQDMIGEGHAWWSSSSPLSSSSSSSSSSLCFSNSLCTQPSSSLLPATPWTNINPPESLSQLLLNGLVGGDERRSCMPFQSKKLDDYNWEDQLVYPTTNAHELLCLKQENYETNNNGYIYFHGDEEIQTFSPRSCATTSSLENNSMLNFSHKFEQKFEHQQQPDNSECFSNENGTPFKKARIQASPQSSVKVRKEKLGDRITALHQIVSPFGKTDTASVLLEAIGYIRFLHGQIQVLSSPYLSSEGGTTHSRHHGKEERNCIFPEDSGQLSNDNSKKQSPQSDQGKKEEDQKKDLRSKGLCLVPVSFPLDIGTDHLITDYWAPAFGVNFTQ